MRRAKNVIYPSITPAETAGEILVRITFPFRHLNHSFTIPVSASLYEGAKSSGKSARVPAGIGDAWLAGYYAAFAEDPALVPFYRAVLCCVLQIRTVQNADYDDYLEMFAAVVQSITYDVNQDGTNESVPLFSVLTVVDNPWGLRA